MLREEVLGLRLNLNMGVLVKPRDVAEQFRRYQLAQAAALLASGEFERACNTHRPSEECQAAWARVGDAERALQSEWDAYVKIAPTRLRPKKKEAA